MSTEKVDWSKLPLHILEKVFAELELKDRFLHAGRVCGQWRAASLSATSLKILIVDIPPKLPPPATPEDNNFIRRAEQEKRRIEERLSVAKFTARLLDHHHIGNIEKLVFRGLDRSDTEAQHEDTTIMAYAIHILCGGRKDKPLVAFEKPWLGRTYRKIDTIVYDRVELIILCDVNPLFTHLAKACILKWPKIMGANRLVFVDVTLERVFTPQQALLPWVTGFTCDVRETEPLKAFPLMSPRQEFWNLLSSCVEPLTSDQVGLLNELFHRMPYHLVDSDRCWLFDVFAWRNKALEGVRGMTKAQREAAWKGIDVGTLDPLVQRVFWDSLDQPKFGIRKSAPAYLDDDHQPEFPPLERDEEDEDEKGPKETDRPIDIVTRQLQLFCDLANTYR